MSQHIPNHREEAQGYIAGLSAERLILPEPYLYKLLLEAKQVEDTAERRREFKRLLVGRQIEEGIPPPQVDQKELADFMNSEDSELKVERSVELVNLLEKHLRENGDFTQAQRMAVLELFHCEAPLRQSEMDRAYFENAELVRADLEALAIATSKKVGKIIHSKDLKTYQIKFSFTLTTGESITGITYLRRAAMVLAKAKNKKGAEKMRIAILTSLKQTAGFEVDVTKVTNYPPTDEAYFNDRTKVRTDLEALAVIVSGKIGKTIQPKDLKTHHFDTFFTITTGESITGHTYIRRIARVLGKAKDSKEAQKMEKEILNLLKKIAGFKVVEYPLLNEAYFNDPVKLRIDLEAIAVVASKKAGKTIQPKNLNTNHIRFFFTLTTGESMHARAYLGRAARSLGKAGNYYESQNMCKEILRILKQAVGFEVIEYPPLYETYFQDGAKVRNDLESLAAAASEKVGKIIQPKNLNIGSHIIVFFTLTTGESIIGQTYLSRAARAFGKAKNAKEAQKMHKEILTLLKQTAGFTTE